MLFELLIVIEKIGLQMYIQKKYIYKCYDVYELEDEIENILP